MKTITTNNLKLIILPVPDDAYNFGLFEKVVGWYNKNDTTGFYNTTRILENCNIIGLLKDIKDEDVEKYVKKYTQSIGWRLDSNIKKLPKISMYCNYLIKKPIPVTMLCNTAKESFISLLQSEGVDTNKSLLILQKQ